ncbi:BQ2448_3295 [Microbotryum intermedium]|uniref:BQ2448_3295 protein n=1 Tax=Microbotryum intermedium TaxID=269621 RepID=A0A238FES2_9BASI|nr:BQ2448_3295 [Microbotryum intermedium]
MLVLVALGHGASEIASLDSTFWNSSVPFEKAVTLVPLCVIASGLPLVRSFYPTSSRQAGSRTRYNDHLEFGRPLWWFHYSESSLAWLGKYGGLVVVDFIYACVGFSIAQIVIERFLSGGQQECPSPIATADLLGGEDPPEQFQGCHSNERERTTNHPEPASRSSKAPFVLLALTILLCIVGPFLNSTPFAPAHPLPSDPSSIYPPLKAGCAVPGVFNLHRARKDVAVSIENWIKARQRSASTGAKILSWSESSVRLENVADEMLLWARVGSVAGMYKMRLWLLESHFKDVFILITYTVPASAPDPRHKRYNAATLIGPTSDPNITSWRTISTTTNHLPVSFIETYASATRFAPELGSFADRLPLACIELPRAQGIPPQGHGQSLELSTAICLDIASPSLRPILRSTSTLLRRSPPLARPPPPHLILNLSDLPDPSFAPIHLDQIRSRALETNSYILRCDSSHGVSALIAPNGVPRVLRPGNEGLMS